MAVATMEFVTKCLPGGKSPTDANMADPWQCITIPFAVLTYDDGLDYDLDGNSYQDSPPDWCLGGAFHDEESATRWMEQSKERWKFECRLEKDHRVNLFELCDPWIIGAREWLSKCGPQTA